MTMSGSQSSAWVALLFLAGCGGGAASAPPETAETARAEPIEAPPPPASELDAEGAEEPESDESSARAERVATPEPTFPENASVSQAIDAVPRETERLNLDPELLGRPLQDPTVYEPCNVGNQPFKLRVAIWNGRAVGVDVDAKNKKVAACIEEQVRKLEWPEKVRSLETVDFSM